ncbi:MAG: M23 family metallopeptidase [Candidatus Hydrogenedentes bacterium]|nr:M23 family metallopeptidase [Candidatus Hydrogenedentota bacterium]
MRKAMPLIFGTGAHCAALRAGLALVILGLVTAGCATDGQTADISHHAFNAPPQPEDGPDSFYEVHLPDIPVATPPREGFIWPVQHPSLYISSGFGQRRSSGGGSGRIHKGNDLICPKGTPVRAAANGKVVQSELTGAYGELVVIEHEGNMSTAYAHMTDRFVEVGTDILQGDIIGTVGDTGNASTDHLHYEVRVGGQPIDPDPYLPGCEKFYR